MHCDLDLRPLDPDIHKAHPRLVWSLYVKIPTGQKTKGSSNHDVPCSQQLHRHLICSTIANRYHNKGTHTTFPTTFLSYKKLPGPLLPSNHSTVELLSSTYRWSRFNWGIKSPNRRVGGSIKSAPYIFIRFLKPSTTWF